MSDQPPSFEHAALEADIKVLAQEIGRYRELPETSSLGEKDLLKRAIRAFPAAPTGDEKTPSERPSSKSPLPQYAQDSSPEVKLEIEYLLDLAFHLGLARAVRESKKSPDFVQDAFHDALAGRLYPELKRMGIL